NNVIIPSLGLNLGGQKISEGTAHAWLAKLGCELKEVKKGMHVDGHEHDGIVTYHKECLENYTDNELEPTEPQLGPNEKLHIPLMHDETIFCANELYGKMPLCKKGEGHAIHVSDWTVKQSGQLTLSESQCQENAALPLDQQLTCTDAHEIIYPGKNYDGFWTNVKFVDQVGQAVNQIFEWMYPNAITEFVFDQSLAHGALTKDALNVKEMNVKPGGKQKIMHDRLPGGADYFFGSEDPAVGVGGALVVATQALAA
ncbi:hypothetical protein EDD16DRAFT_1468478, partial [Pisolithus croceorrhizus]